VNTIPTKYPHLSIVGDAAEVEEMPDTEDEFSLLGMWMTKDNRLAIVLDITPGGLMTGVVSRNGRTYDCVWDQDQISQVPFKFVDDLAIKLE
jgi:hypothetical protein